VSYFGWLVCGVVAGWCVTEKTETYRPYSESTKDTRRRFENEITAK
jgi:hypothetical protein